MYNNTGEEIPFLTKVKIVGAMAVAAIIVILITGGVVMMQRDAKTEAAREAKEAVALAKKQVANVEKVKATLPLFKETNMSMVKISVEDLPATITAGLDETVSPNPTCESVPAIGGDDWYLEGPGFSVNSANPNDWAASGASVSIPADAVYGTYILLVNSHDICDTEKESLYHYTFKITPPCPTGVTIGISAIPKP